jgi:peptidoglycan/LPS O-acetylase OafA/YrhL
MWSLAVEEHFYLFLPLLFIWLSRRRPKQASMYLAAAIAAVTVWRIILTFGTHAGFDRLDLSTDTRVDSLYLLDRLAIDGWTQAVSSLGKFGLLVPAFVTTIVGAEVLHILVEKPSNRLRHRLESADTSAVDGTNADGALVRQGSRAEPVPSVVA